MKNQLTILALAITLLLVSISSQAFAQQSSPKFAQTLNHNVMRLELKPDLYAMFFNGSPNPMIPGEIILGTKIKNKGLKNAGAFKVKVLYRIGRTKRWNRLQEAGVASLDVGKFKALSFRHAVSSGKTYYYKMIIDHTNWIDEHNETNNIATTSVTFP